MKNRDIPNELVDAALNFRDIAMRHGYKVIGCAFHPASNRIKAGAVSIFHTGKIAMVHQISEIMEAMNEELEAPYDVDKITDFLIEDYAQDGVTL